MQKDACFVNWDKSFHRFGEVITQIVSKISEKSFGDYVKNLNFSKPKNYTS